MNEKVYARYLEIDIDNIEDSSLRGLANDLQILLENALFEDIDIKKKCLEITERVDVTKVDDKTKYKYVDSAMLEHLSKIEDLIRKHPGIRIRDIVTSIGIGPYRNDNTMKNVIYNRVRNGSIRAVMVKKGRVYKFYPRNDLGDCGGSIKTGEEK